MNRGLTFVLDQLNPKLRAQAQRKLDALRLVSSERIHACLDDTPTSNETLIPRGPRKRMNRPQQIQKLSDPEERLAFHLKADGIEHFLRQFQFIKGRRWRADFAWLKERLLVEVQGGIWKQGRHVRGSGYERDRERQNEAVLAGWRTLEFTPGHVKTGKAVRDIRRALEAFSHGVTNVMR